MAVERPDSIPQIARRLRLVRRAYGVLQGRTPDPPTWMGQAEFGRLCGIEKSAWNNSETGDSRIGLDSALAVVRRTGVTLDFIYRGERAGLPHALAVEIENLERDEQKPKRALARSASR